MRDFVDATKQTAGFTASCAIAMWIWHTHAVWSQRYGHRRWDNDFLSSSLII
jgi:hypothetical protein